MNALEWSGLSAAAPRWRRLAEGLGDGLEAVFDDAGRAGLGLTGGDARRWRLWSAALAAEGLAAPRAPAVRAWVFLDGGRAREAWSLGSGGELLRLSPGAKPERGRVSDRRVGGTREPALDALLADFAGLHPLSALSLCLDRLEARLTEPAPWPLFARCDAAKPFAAQGAAWARRLGARAVSGFALGRGRMEIFVQ
ncbi:MAG: hypothetical protein HYZ75_06645 [Elusimicrobia bacterium]|nr:hypothetical protein [Elusimicrobiota bacterium]